MKFSSRVRFFFFIFLIAACANIVGEALYNEPLIYSTKPLLLSSLALCFYFALPVGLSNASRFILAGFSFSWAGDILLMLVPRLGAHFFIFGLLSFLLAHIFYIAAFWNLSARFGYNYLAKKPWAVLPFLFYFGLLSIWLWGDLDDLKYPVVLYSAVISFMGISAMNVRKEALTASFGVLLTGVILFILSDSMIAVNKFKFEFPGARIWIMASYVVAQACIAWAALRYITGLNGAPVSKTPDGNH